MSQSFQNKEPKNNGFVCGDWVSFFVAGEIRVVFLRSGIHVSNHARLLAFGFAFASALAAAFAFAAGFAFAAPLAFAWAFGLGSGMARERASKDNDSWALSQQEGQREFYKNLKQMSFVCLASLQHPSSKEHLRHGQFHGFLVAHHQLPLLPWGD